MFIFIFMLLLRAISKYTKIEYYSIPHGAMEQFQRASTWPLLPSVSAAPAPGHPHVTCTHTLGRFAASQCLRFRPRQPGSSIQAVRHQDPLPLNKYEFPSLHSPRRKKPILPRYV